MATTDQQGGEWALSVHQTVDPMIDQTVAT